MSPWWLVGAFTAVAFWLRTALLYRQVFGTPGFVNYLDTDAWWHVRMIEHWARNFPFRLTVDPYGRIEGGGQPIDSGLFYDLPLALIGWAGQFSPETLHQWAAWYPAVLGAAIVPVTFLAGRAIFGVTAGLWAAAVVATLPGHFLQTGSVGYTDHHVLEALLTALLLWLLARPGTSPWALGTALTAYLLTFAGGGFVVLLVAGWYWLQALPTPELDARPFALACLIAVPFATWQRHVYLMNYTLAALLLTAGFLWLLPRFAAWCRQQSWPRAAYGGATLLAGAAALGLVAATLTKDESVFEVLGRLTAAGPLAGTVSELQSLTRAKGFFSLEYPWREFGGALVFSLIGLPLLAEAVWRRAEPRQLLLALWAGLFFLMAMTQARMTYYFGYGAALLSGWLMSQVAPRSAAALLLGAFLILPNAWRAVNDQHAFYGQVSPDWRATLTYLREQTPEPFGDANAYWGRPARPADYSVLSWWDSGYWIVEVARRVPVTNPTQTQAHRAAAFLLETDEAAARQKLDDLKARYVVLDRTLPLLGDERSFRGAYPNLFAYHREAREADYWWRAPNGRVYLKAKYFQSMAVRLFLGGGAGLRAAEAGSFVVLAGGQERGSFKTLSEAQAVASQCAGCEVLSGHPLLSPVDVPPVTWLEPVFDSPNTAARIRGAHRAEAQVYRWKQ